MAYFAYFQYPLTAFEIWKWLLEPGQAVTLAQVAETLEASEWLRTRIVRGQGFFALEKIEPLLISRRTRFLDAVRKYHKAQKTAKLLARLPWIEGVAVCNSLAWYSTTKDSDIDLFVIVTPGRLWSARLLATLPLRLLRQRPGENVHDPLCLSFFCTPEGFDFTQIKVADTDPYLAYWSLSLVPLVQRQRWQQQFIAENAWLQEVLPNAYPVLRAPRFRLPKVWRWPWLPFAEKLPRQIQMDKFPAALRELMNRDTRVVVNDKMLKFHDQDRRTAIVTALQDKMSAL